ncbi:coenzyme F420-0 gamma-glutamyl ligase [Longilinea arvoryzae]|uniref:Coenzyme F420-0 gamma-glutamyl ligase n=1 Tax=Longilinea arvoryzae TaxID=360412 RepID=A0A0S7BLR3_9CHLR|nr:coenzyme F420-0:L-glutamate ligase [Longilinea arvoryzae]GAP14709.1 coenzyme F420-0 gamma-glutamyl ligase [Longilinea arvoryzae]
MLSIIPIEKIPLIRPGDDLAGILLNSLGENQLQLQDGDIIVLAQKIVSKAENRLVNLTQVEPSAEAISLAEKTEKDARMLELVLRESRSVLRYRPGTVIVEHKLGFVCANAGIDHSNVQGLWGNKEDWVLLLPENPDLSAARIRERLGDATGVYPGVMIIDSHGRAWRLGTVGVTIGLAGMPGLVDLRGREDMFGFHLRVTQVAAADELAAAASLVMGQAAEHLPAVLARGFPYPLRDGSLNELIRPEDLDLFR